MLQAMQSIHDKFPLLTAFEANPWQATAEHYAQCLTEKAKLFSERYLKIDPDHLEGMGIGFSDRSLGSQLPASTTSQGKGIRSKLTELGLYKQNGRETLRGYVTIPLVDSNGTVTGLEAYRLDKNTSLEDRILLGSGERRPCVKERQAVGPENQPEVDATSAAVKAPAPASPLDITVEAHCVTIHRGDRSYKIRGLEKNMSSLTLRVSIAASRLEKLHLDTVDLMRASARQAFVRAAAVELYCDEETIKTDLGRLLLQLEDLRNLQIEAAKRVRLETPTMTPSEEEEALTLLKDSDLIGRIVQDLDRCGMVGESLNKLVAYLAVISRKLTHPLALLIQSSSSAGKTTLMEHVLAMAPPEEVLRLSNLTSQSLYYLDSDQLKHRTLAISEDHGLSEAAYALKLLQSEGKLTHATVTRGSDGKSVTQLHSVEGPVQLLLTSTCREIDEELANRCLILTVDESSQQTQSIQMRQRLLQTRQGELLRQEAAQLQHLHRNAQRLLRPLKIYNPLTDKLEFSSQRLRNRRDHAKYLSLIQAIALLHQHQRTIHQEEDGSPWIEVQESDIALAKRLMDKLLSQSLNELAPQTERCLQLVRDYALSECRRTGIDSKSQLRFTRREFRESIGWSDNQVRIHFERLVQLEHLIVHRGKQGRTYVYELAD